MGPISLNANCQDDQSAAPVNDVQKLIDHKDDAKEDDDEILDAVVFDPIFVEEDLQNVHNESISWASSSVCQKLNEKLECDSCKETIETSDYGRARPSLEFELKFQRLLSWVNQIIPDLCSEHEISKKILDAVSDFDCTDFGCDDHKCILATNFKKCTIN